MPADAQFTDLGGDSLSALTFANLLHEIFDVEVPVGVIVSPASDLAAIAAYIEAERRPGGASGRPSRRCTAATRPRRTPRDLTLDKFIDAETLAAAPSLPGPSAEIRTVLLTGATGFLGRYLALEWLERMDLVGGKVICLVRAKDDAAARARLDATFDSGDPEAAGALPRAGRRTPRGDRRRQGRGQPRARCSTPGSGWPTPST